MSLRTVDPEHRAQQRQALPGGTLRRLYVRSDRPGLLRALSHFACLVAGGFLVWATLGSVWVLPAMLLQGLFLVSLFAVMHECTHYTAFASRWPNDLCAFIAGAAILQVASFYRRFHMAHHLFTQDPARDPELLAAPLPRTRGEFWLRISALPYWHLRLVQLVAFPLGRFGEVDFLDARARAEVMRSSRLLLGLLLAGLAISLWLQTAALLWYWLLPVVLAMPVLRLYLVCEHAGCSEDDDAFANTRTTLTVWPVRQLMWNMPFHAEHHLYPNIPFHALPAAHDLLRSKMKVVAPGYLATLRDVHRACAPKAAT